MSHRDNDLSLAEMRTALWLGLKGVEGPTVHPSRLDEFERMVRADERERPTASASSGKVNP